MTPPPLRRRRAKAKVVRAWAARFDDGRLHLRDNGTPTLFSVRQVAAWYGTPIRVEIREIRTTAPKRGRKKGKR